MEPVTHVLTGVCLARCGLNRKAAYATLTMAIAAELPDIDTIWSLRGPVEGFQHHRGITHTFIGLPIEAALLVAAVWAWHRWRGRAGAAPVKWGVLYGCALVALLSHLWLDYTNNYGVRPFFPFDRQWYAGSFVFIFDPWLFLMLLAALVMPWLFGLVGAEVGAKRPVFRGRGWAIAAMLGVCAWWGVRAWEHQAAVSIVQAQTMVAPAPESPAPGTPAPGTPAASDPAEPVPPAGVPVYLTPMRVQASPDLWSPFRWYTVADYGQLYQLGAVELPATASAGSFEASSGTYAKPPRTPAVLAAMRSPLGRAYMDWSPMPIVTETAGESDPAQNGSQASTIVTFADPRFMRLDLGGRSALTATVLVDARGQIVEQAMDGRVER